MDNAMTITVADEVLAILTTLYSDQPTFSTDKVKVIVNNVVDEDPVTKDNIMGFELPGCPIKANIPGHLLRAANIQAGRNLKRILHLCQSPLQVTLHPT